MKPLTRPLKLAALKPRNPCLVPSLRRHAGPHRAAGGSRRQHLAQELRRELRIWRIDP